ncbi:MAG: isoprenoid biosynthesis glyoxalase ElbB [Bacteroidales bacterium]|jgi:enhancing lycopene biosynthesis protein 2|nr:isoprenoid biosynthesis glyoxalase ElbB [Bacteroidales bacterium]MBQ4478683.1 isoprenoid biosynthesis glyoxalase ElbB [Bacteroidales bacterium]MBR4452852.1 isoprenoid biosynthesis glyoxalase ElbB [Bacteroidales bacterium]MCR5555036.1 isoprenoid biosynthesis glyoxalase ElbB [Bacteroidales bacterium]
MKKKIAIIIGGCGHRDGSEIHETTMTMLAVEEHGATYQMFAPNRNQYHVLNHLDGTEMHEQRNMLVEAARIARGNILPLENFDVNQFDAVIFPGGFGVAKNFFNYAFKGMDCEVDEQIAHIIQSVHQAGKPIGALCISPVLMAKILGNITVTIGQDAKTARDIEQMGATNVNTSNGDVVTDKKNKIFSTPCYMLDANLVDIHEDAYNLVEAMMEYM